MKSKIVVIFIVSFLFLSMTAYSADEKINYQNILEIDVEKSNDFLWKIFEDVSQDSSKLFEERRFRAIFVGRYPDFADQYEMEIHEKLSLYRSPFQAKVLFMDHYMKKFIGMKKINNANKVYLIINNLTLGLKKYQIIKMGNNSSFPDFKNSVSTDRFGVV